MDKPFEPQSLGSPGPTLEPPAAVSPAKPTGKIAPVSPEAGDLPETRSPTELDLTMHLGTAIEEEPTQVPKIHIQPIDPEEKEFLKSNADRWKTWYGDMTTTLWVPAAKGEASEDVLTQM